MLIGEGLTSDISLNLVGGDSIHFTVSPRTITPEMAAQGVVITLSFFPYSIGELSTNLIISNPDVDDITIPLSGYGIKTGAYLYPSADSLAFSASAGRTMVKTIGVLKKNFDGWIASPRVDPISGDDPDINGSSPNAISDFVPVVPILITSVNGEIEGPDADSFSIMLTTRTTSSTGCDSVIFTICYSPLEEGVHNATLVLSTPILNNRYPAHPVRVPLTGICVSDPPGDMNGDGQLTVTDVIMLIDRVINAERSSLELVNADVNGDGEVNITDIVGLIDTVLHSQ